MRNKPRALNDYVTWWLALPKAMIRKIKVHYLHRFAAPIPFIFDGKNYLEMRFNYPFPHANCVAIGYFKK